MTSETTASCSVEGARYFPVGGDEDAICARFRREFYAALSEQANEETYSFALHVTKDGTVSARISGGVGSVTRTYPEVSVDVMDRALNYSDISQLAGAAAQLVKTGQTGA